MRPAPSDSTQPLDEMRCEKLWVKAKEMQFLREPLSQPEPRASCSLQKQQVCNEIPIVSVIVLPIVSRVCAGRETRALGETESAA